MTRSPDILAIELTPEEIDDAIYEGKVKKYFYEKHKDYWIEKENEKPKKSKAERCEISKL
jgi:cytochrome b subunit of formate dehydrogenase